MNRAPSITVVRQRFARSAERETLAETELSQTNCDDCQPPQETDVPATLSILFAQRQAARQVAFSSAPVPGKIVLISPDDQAATSGVSTEPLAVLLDSEIAAGKWRGWLVGRDPGYACEWDLILGPEDEPRDPSCQVVQCGTLSLWWLNMQIEVWLCFRQTVWLSYVRYRRTSHNRRCPSPLTTIAWESFWQGN